MRGLLRNCCAFVAALATASLALAQSLFAFDVPAQSLDQSLAAVSRAAKINVLVDSTLVAGRRAPALKATLSADEAFSRLLDGTGLQHSFVDSHTVSVTAVITARPATIGAVTQQPAPIVTADAAASASLRSNEVVRSADSANSVALEPVQLEEVLVTGSHIPGRASAGSRVIVISHDDIDRSGQATAQGVLRTLPQNFIGGVSDEDRSDRATTGNFAAGSSANLRGLGPNATLVLVNGRRVTPSGTNGSFSDLTSIPPAAIERIEILTDGASAVYGSDAVGGVINFILRKDYEGIELRFRGGEASGGGDEQQAALTAGHVWSTGSGLFGYQFSRREPLRRGDRAYTASDDLRPFGGSDYRRTFSNPGNILNAAGQPAFAIPANQDGTDLDVSDLLPGAINYQRNTGAVDLLPEQRQHSVYLNLNQQLGDVVDAFLDSRYGARTTTYLRAAPTQTIRVPATNPFYVNPAGGTAPVAIAYDFADDFGLLPNDADTKSFATTIGLIGRFANAWESTLSAQYSREDLTYETTGINNAALTARLADPNPATAFNPFGDGSHTARSVIDAIRGIQHEEATSRLWGATWVASGPIATLPTGDLRSAFGLDYRREELHATQVSTNTNSSSAKDVGRGVTAVFAELSVPLVDPHLAWRGLQALDLSLAGRFERYSDFGDTFNPKAGLRAVPFDGLALRATWGHSFRAPGLVDRVETTGTSVILQPFSDPLSTQPNRLSNVLYRSGNNADLSEETASVWTFGIDTTDQIVRGLTTSVSYYRIAFKDRIAPGGPAGAQVLNILFQPDEWRSIITRNPSAEQIASLCNSPQFFGSVSTCLNTPIAAIVDGRLRNLAEVRTQGIDLSAQMNWSSPVGAIRTGLTGNYVLRFERAVTSTSPFVDLVDTVGNPPSLRLRAELSWTRGALSAASFVNYTGSYDDPIRQPTRTVGSWTTADLRLAYQSRHPGWLNKLQVALGATNIFDRAPPFVDNPFLGYDSANATLIGRVVSAQLSKEW